MQSTDDGTLLRAYVESNSDDAFTLLVTRHINLVYSVALRCVGNPHQAEEITQVVFIILAKKAAELRHDKALSSWLFQATHLTANNFVRGEIRRHRREQETYMRSTYNESVSNVWEKIAPLLDPAVAALKEKDRHAIVLRFYEGRNLSEVGTALGTSEEAAKKRVQRAVEKLQRYFLRRGIVSTTGAIAGAISANSLHAAPACLAESVSAVAVTKGAAASAWVATNLKGVLKIMAWVKAKTAITIGAGILLAVATATVTFSEIANRRAEESWRKMDVTSSWVAKAPPLLKILPTKFSKPGNMAGTPPGIDKFVGIGQPVSQLVCVAYAWPIARTLYADGEPPERYDFISTLPKVSRQALQQELKRKPGLVGHLETRDTDVLLLKIRNPHAPGLNPPTNGRSVNYSHNENGYEIKWDNQPLPRICILLEQHFKMPIIDTTELTQPCSVDIKWEEVNGYDADQVVLKRVLLEQLGLELLPSRQAIEMLVVEKVK